MAEDSTRQLLEQLLAQLYEQQADEDRPHSSSYLQAEDEQFLGNINANPFDRDSILNQYGPYGSPYSTTSIFNEYSDYGSHYGNNSINNPYCTTPPKLFINGRYIGRVSVNPYVQDRIPTDSFLFSLKNDVNGLLAGRVVDSEVEARKQQAESFIEAGDGTFLGKLTPNRFDHESIFNRFGPYGSKFSQIAIYNKFGTYGNQFNPLSPYNKFSTNPPKLYVKGRFVAFLTKNHHMSPRVDPDDLQKWAENNVSRFG